MSIHHQIEDTWCEHIPLLHRILAAPGATEQFPRVSSDLGLHEACSIWETLHYLLRYLMGWDDPGAGLAWWYAAGKPVDDSPLLKTVIDLWDRENQLDYYAAWAWTEYGTREKIQNQKWWSEFMQRPKPDGHNPYFGGSNPLHLGHSDHFGRDQTDPDHAQLHFDESERKAVLIVNRIASWLRDLESVEAQLPNLGDRSWHVEVFDRQAGYLGLFRQSRETQRWFQGKHSIHVQGQRKEVSQ